MENIRYFIQDKKHPTEIHSFEDIPSNIKLVFEKLSHLAFIAIDENKCHFTINEIEKEIPGLTRAFKHSGELGIINSVQLHDNILFYFVHFSIKEYLAAYYINSLPPDALLDQLKGTFWSNNYINTWIMYLGIANRNYDSVIQFLSDEWKNPKNALYDKMKQYQLHVLYYLGIISDIDTDDIENFLGGSIDLSNQTLPPDNVMKLGILFKKWHHRKWNKLDLSGCCIDDEGCDKLFELFPSSNYKISINTVDIT